MASGVREGPEAALREAGDRAGAPARDRAQVGVDPGEQLADVEEQLAEVEETTEERMHSVADLIPEKSEEIHERADRLSENAAKHYRRVQRRRADDDERDG